MKNEYFSQERALILSRIAGQLGISNCQKLSYTEELASKKAAGPRSPHCGGRHSAGNGPGHIPGL